VAVDQVTPDGLRLDDGSMFFQYPAARTDLMQRLATLAESLSPAQLALTMNDVRRDESLWPVRASMRWGIKTSDGASVPAGQEVVMMGFLPDGSFRAGAVEQNVTVPVDPWFTDLFPRARQRVGTDDGTPFDFRLLESMLEPSADGSTVGDYDYVVMYDGRDTCSRSVDFAPELAEFQRRSAETGERWLLVLVNGAARPAQNHAHYRNMGLQGRAAKDGWGQALYAYFDLGGYQTPWLHVFDQDANEISTAGDSPRSASLVLGLLAERIETP